MTPPRSSSVDPELPSWAAAEPALYTTPSGKHDPVPPRDSLRQQVNGRVQDRTQFAEAWIGELRSGRHTQARCGWDTGTGQCVNKVAIDEFGVTLGDIRDAYGSTTVNELFYRNDIECHSFDELSKFMKRTLVDGRAVELER